MKANYLVTIFISILIYSCDQEELGDKIYWFESNAICVHWSDFGKKNFETKAIIIVLRASDPKVYESKLFYLNTTVDKEISFLLERTEKVKKDENNYFLFLYIRSAILYDLFPEGMNYYNDDCYHIELANMIGRGKIVMVSNENKISIGKSSDYSFHVGPK